MRHPNNQSAQFQFPPMSPFTKNVLIGLFGLFIAELVARALGLPIDLLVWFPFNSGGFSPTQLLTRYFVQGAGSGAVTGVLLGLLILYFFLDQVRDALTSKQFAEAMASIVIGGSLMGLTMDAMGFARTPTMGWTSFVTGLVVLFGLSNPKRTILLFLVLPIGGMTLVYATVVITFVYFLAEPGLATAEEIGAWMGVWGWFIWRGPGGRRRSLKRKAKTIERELHRLRVIDGGLAQGDQGNDDIIH